MTSLHDETVTSAITTDDLKIQDFNTKMRSGIGQQVDVAQASPK